MQGHVRREELGDTAAVRGRVDVEHARADERLSELSDPLDRVVADDGGVWPLDRASATLRVQANDVTVTSSTTGWAISPGLLVVVGLALVAWFIRRRRRRRAVHPGDKSDGPREKVLVGS